MMMIKKRMLLPRPTSCGSWVPLLSGFTRGFSTQVPEPQEPKAPKKGGLKQGLKMPKLEEGEEVIGFRPYGNNNL